MKTRSLALVLSALALGTASFVASAADHVFSNTTAITKTGGGAATPYPSSINVNALTGNITNVTVTVHGFSENLIDFPYLALVSPGGQKIMLFNGRSFTTNQTTTNADWTFSNTGSAFSAVADIPSGTYLPTDVFQDAPPAPAPVGPYSTDLTILNGSATAQNGSWSLYVAHAPGREDAALLIAGGWSLNISDDAPDTTCASEGYTGTKLTWYKNICENGLTGATLDIWIHRWINRYRDLPYCAQEGGGEEEPPPQET